MEKWGARIYNRKKDASRNLEGKSVSGVRDGGMSFNSGHVNEEKKTLLA
jgi:hypothetical protein